jgi:hypothetical protein
MKAEPVLSNGAFRFLWLMLKTPLKGLLWILPFYLLFLLPDLTDELRKLLGNPESGFWKTVLDIISFLRIPEILIALILAMLLLSLRTWLRKKNSKKGVSESEEVRLMMRESAGKIADLLKVKFVVFGHTHFADAASLNGNSFYFNTGTWMGIFAPEEELYRNAKQFTYFMLEGDEGKLLHWNIDRDLPEEVVVVETETPLTKDEDSIVKILFSTITGK